ncbi:DUF1206 domain-containing protein [Hymenobacter cavernae]|uniref:DUF1206 domain-containing protein n=1 Tax=Hymenobacter cavernae TaxID=2044852 RepID=A0ABQ1U7K6_9BACT|nr:DUF1206 domain-containing protein [Hymenobacter cavernae]GGF11121.1 hypothetical protein GCM10011383_22880 [Hymenobacter cavernae]
MESITTSIPTILPSPAASLKAWARVGFASIGFVYLVLGVLATMAALGVRGSDTPNQQEVFQTIQHMPLGQVLLWLVAGGLLGYVAWRLAQALLDTERQGAAAKGLAFRGFYVFSGLLYAMLAFYAAKIAWYGRLPREDDASRSALRSVLHHEYGQELLALVGLVVLSAGAIQVYRAWSGKFDTDVQHSPFSYAQRRLVYRMGQVGYSARGVVLLIMGYFCFMAAQHANVNEIRDTEGCFQALEAMSPDVLGIVALGLVIYGVYMFIQARFPILRGL